ncbi:MAG: sugar transferase [Sneathiella sp.]|nr:sugar transferase [Sneathiella sp.]
MLFLAAALIKIDDGTVFFIQERIGKDAQIFSVYKFRTMILDAKKYLDAN